VGEGDVRDLSHSLYIIMFFTYRVEHLFHAYQLWQNIHIEILGFAQ